MTTTDTIHARGQVTPSFLDIRTGNKVPWERRHNTISYEASFSMASAFGGDLTYIPNRIGIIYGPTKTISFDTISRYQNWSELHDELAVDTRKSDVQVMAFSCTPTLKSVQRGDDSSSSDPVDGDVIPGHAVTFHAHSDSVTPGAFGTCGYASGTERGQIFTKNTFIYQAVLLNKTGSDYRIIARASLGNKTASGIEYYQKPENFEVAIDWTIKFF